MDMDASQQRSLKLRTISFFIPRLCSSLEEWSAEIAQAAAFLKHAQQLYEQHGYEVQTLRIVTRALSVAASAEAAAALAGELERLCLAASIQFLSLGGTRDLGLVRQGVFSRIAAVTNYTSCSFNWQRDMGQVEANELAAAIHGLEEGKRGASFRFGVAFNCPPGIPFFPVAAAAPAEDDDGGLGSAGGFALGTENSGLLYKAFQAAAAEATASGGSVLAAAEGQLRAAMAAALQPLEVLAEQLAAGTGRPYLGIDASIAPALQPPSIPQSYELLGLGRFGGGGTLAISGEGEGGRGGSSALGQERITAALKSLPLKLCGYSGLMLPVMEDAGLSAAADEGRISLGSLLHYSAVCGCGLDTVPVPGATTQQPEAERRELLSATAALLLDVAALAFRLGKPLSARLLPVPGGRAGERTAFESPYLLNCAVLPLV